MQIMPIRKPHPNARRLRKDMPAAEQRLWARLRGRRLGDYRFRRQHTIGPYIADFACVEAMLVVELDGDQHALGAAPMRDAARDRFMEDEGWLVLRFWNNDVYGNIAGVLDAILEAAETSRQFLATKPDAED